MPLASIALLLLSPGSLQAYVNENIFTTVERTNMSWKLHPRRVKSYPTHKNSFYSDSCSFMPLYFFCFQLFWRSSNKTYILADQLFLYILFFPFTTAITFFMPCICNLRCKKHHLFFLKHIYHGKCNFHDMNVSSTTVFMISN